MRAPTAIQSYQKTVKKAVKETVQKWLRFRRRGLYLSWSLNAFSSRFLSVGSLLNSTPRMAPSRA